MPTKTSDKNPIAPPDEALAVSEIFSILAHDRRRYMLHYLSRQIGAVSLGELAEQLAIWEGELTQDRYERILTGFHHTHLPQLAEAGLITYDLDQENVQLIDASESVASYLELAVKDDFQ